MLALCAPSVASATEPADSGAGQVIARFRSDTQPADRSAVRSEAGTAFEQALPIQGMQLLDPQPGVSVQEAVARLERSGEILYAEPDATRSAAATANDPLFSQQWGLHMIGMPDRKSVV